MKIIVTNTVCLNGGDAAILIALTRLLKRAYGPDCELVVMDSQAEIAARYYPEFQFQQLLYEGYRKKSLTSLRVKSALLHAQGKLSLPLAAPAQEVLKSYQDADLVVSTGGTYLVEYYDLRHRITEFALAAAWGKPLVFFTQSLGPFEKSRSQLRPFFENSPLVALRDELSKSHLQEMGVEGPQLQVFSDCVFSLADERAEQLQQRQLPASDLDVVVSLRSWRHFTGKVQAGMQNYLDALAAACTRLVRERGARVELLSTCQGIPEYWTDDSALAVTLFESLPADVQASVQVNREFHTPDQLIARFHQADFVIATRMHAAILALIAGTPVLPIAYEFKTTELFAAMGFADWVSEMDSMTESDFLQTLERFLTQLDSRRAALQAAVLLQIQSAARIVEPLSQLLG